MTIPANIITDLEASTRDIFNGSAPLVLVLFGIVIGFYLVRNILGLIPKIKS